MSAARRWLSSPWIAPLLLAGVCLLAYGLLFRSLGFYWDDWPINWIAQHMGPDGLERYFATNRPYWGELYKLTTQLLGAVPWRWQVFGLFWRWLTALLFWLLARQAWPARPRAALAAALLFAVYPGFSQQFTSLVYSHFFIVLSAFLASLWLSLRALAARRGRWILTGLALLLSLFNLLTMEYFFVLDLVRPLLLWAALGEESLTPRKRIQRAFLAWLPYLAVFLGAGLWRAFFFKFQTQNYQPKLLELARSNPLAALGQLIVKILKDTALTGLGAWLWPLRTPDPGEMGGRTFQIYAALVLLTALGLALFWMLSRSGEAAKARRWEMPLLGLAGLLLAGWPFWLTGLPPGLQFPVDRFTLPFMLGASLLAAGLVSLLPEKRGWQALALSLLVAFALGKQFENANVYRRDWSTYKTFFWQMSWRMPGLRPDTLILVNDLPVTYFSDNSLTGPLNWVYGPTQVGESMPYLLYYPTVRANTTLKVMRPGIAIRQDYLAAVFNGSTSRAVALFYQPPACLRVLDPDLDPLNLMIPVEIREAAALTNTAVILSSGDLHLDAPLFGAEPGHAWCYYFELADLARQQGDWQRVAELGDLAFQTGDYPNDPSERIPFIEGYAHVGNWQRAQELTDETAAITPAMQPVLCRLWQRIGQQTGAPEPVQAALAGLNCK